MTGAAPPGLPGGQRSMCTRPSGPETEPEELAVWLAPGDWQRRNCHRSMAITAAWRQNEPGRRTRRCRPVNFVMGLDALDHLGRRTRGARNARPAPRATRHYATWRWRACCWPKPSAPTGLPPLELASGPAMIDSAPGP